MPYSFVLKESALKDLGKAITWYEEKQDGLGISFRSEVLNKLNKICKNPLHYKINHKNFHEALTERFPFLIIYVIDENEQQIVVVAIFHTSRNLKKKFRR